MAERPVALPPDNDGRSSMHPSVEFRILENCPGWYWEVIYREVLARGVADSQENACAQAAAAKKRIQSVESERGNPRLHQTARTTLRSAKTGRSAVDRAKVSPPGSL